MKTGVLSYNKLVEKTRRLVRRHQVPLHWSRTQNEKFDVHTICVLFVLFQIEQKDYRTFQGWLEIAPALGLKNIPHWTTLQKAFARLPPRLLRKLMQIAGKCDDRIAALDPTYYQLSNPSAGYCKRIGRNPAQEKLRKVLVMCTTNKKKVMDIVMMAEERHGMFQIRRTNASVFQHRTVLADKEFDAESFHQLVEDAGGKAIVPVRAKTTTFSRVHGQHRKHWWNRGIPRVY